MIKIGISGLANSGKNTVANLLADHFQNHCKLIAFADPIKEIALTMFPQAERKCLYGASSLRDNVIENAYDENGAKLTYRKLLCNIGTQARTYNNNIWVNVFDDRVEKLSSNISAVIATDTRFREEIDYLKNHKYYLIRLYRNTNKSKINHISETGQAEIKDSEFNYILYNNKPIDGLKKEINDLIIPNIIA